MEHMELRARIQARIAELEAEARWHEGDERRHEREARIEELQGVLEHLAEEPLPSMPALQAAVNKMTTGALRGAVMKFRQRAEHAEGTRAGLERQLQADAQRIARLERALREAGVPVPRA